MQMSSVPFILTRTMGLDRLHFDTLVFAAVIFTGVGLVLRSYAGKSRAAEGPGAGPH